MKKMTLSPVPNPVRLEDARQSRRGALEPSRRRVGLHPRAEDVEGLDAYRDHRAGDATCGVLCVCVFVGTRERGKKIVVGGCFFFLVSVVRRRSFRCRHKNKTKSARRILPHLKRLSRASLRPWTSPRQAPASAAAWKGP